MDRDGAERSSPAASKTGAKGSTQRGACNGRRLSNFAELHTNSMSSGYADARGRGADPKFAAPGTGDGVSNEALAKIIKAAPI